MYLDVLNDNMVVFANISARDMLDQLFSTFGNITAVDLEINFEHIRRAWDPQQPVESLFKQIQDCAYYYEAGGVLSGQLSFNPSPNNYCWTHGYKVANTYTSLSCNFPKQGHKREATRADNMGGSQANKE
jgi:hypothetical protein